MTPESENRRRANFILQHADLYANDPIFQTVVDRTVYLTDEQKEKSILEVDRVYGGTSPLVGREYEFGRRHGS